MKKIIFLIAGISTVLFGFAMEQEDINRNLLHFACEKGHAEIVKLLLEKGALVDETDLKGRTPPHWAIAWGDFATANVLLEHGASLNRRDSKSQWTPLYMACKNGHADIVKLLLEKGALVDETDSWICRYIQ